MPHNLLPLAIMQVRIPRRLEISLEDVDKKNSIYAKDNSLNLNFCSIFFGTINIEFIKCRVYLPQTTH